jgi:hypothetical protein
MSRRPAWLSEREPLSRLRSIVSRLPRFVPSILAATVAIHAAEPTPVPPPAAPAALLDAILHTELDHDAAVGLTDVALEIGDAELHVDSGVLVPATPVRGKRFELVFVGQSRFRLRPPDDVEAGQLELFTGRPYLDAPVEAAVLVIGDAERVAALLERFPPRVLRPNLRARAETVHGALLQKSRSGSSGAEAAIYQALVGDAFYRHYFGVWCRSYELGEFVYQLDPEDEEPLTVASFIPLDVKGWDRRRLERNIRLQQRKGRWLGVRLEDLGAWDVWLSSDWEAGRAVELPGRTGFEARHYELDVTVRRRKMRMDGRARITVDVLDDGRKAVPLELFRDLVIDEVRDGRGRELYYFRSRGEYIVELPEPSRAGEELQLDVSYHGRVVKWVGRQIFDLEDTDAWYPHCGTIDRATYDVTLRWPKRYEMVAGGVLVDHGRDGNLVWERRVLELPSIAFSFVVGDLHVEQVQVDDVALTMGFSKSTPRRVGKELRAEILDVVTAALAFFERTFGEYPLDELSVVALPRRFSQSYLGFVTLSDTLVRSSTHASEDSRWVRDTTIAHELAHQWWGNRIGWSSYRDQWLSEAMANYSALLFYARTYDQGGSFLAEMSSGWRESLSQTTAQGVTVESLGPVVLGGRLNSSLASNGYRAIVYRKGAVVLAMLARAIGEEAFLTMLRSLVEAAADRVITTEDFIGAIEHMSGIELDGFARQYVYGTGIPEVYYDYRVEQRPDGGWRTTGTARRVSRPDHRQGVVRTVDGGWDVVRTPETPRRGSSTMLMVPYVLGFDSGPPGPADGIVRRSPGDASLHDRIFLSGTVEEFAIETAARPRELVFDPRGEVLARFYSAERQPKLVEIYRAVDLATQGRRDEAEATYRRALELDVGLPAREPALPWMRNRGRDRQLLDARIRLALARIYVDTDRDFDARVQLDAVDELLGDESMTLRVERDVLRGRLDLRRGDYEATFRRMKKTFRRAAPRRAVNWYGYVWKLRLSSERLAMADAFALQAVASFETGNRQELEWALGEARERGADLTQLEVAIARRAARPPTSGPR